jgi:plasmid maintenance system antidote protein VapI
MTTLGARNKLPPLPRFVKPKALPPLPGNVLKEYMKEERISVAEMALRTGTSREYVGMLLNGKAPMGIETALKLEYAIPGTTAEYWACLHTNRCIAMARVRKLHTDRTPMSEREAQQRENSALRTDLAEAWAR